MSSLKHKADIGVARFILSSSPLLKYGAKIISFTKMSTFIAKEDILSQDFQEKKTLKFIYQARYVCE